MTIPNCTTENVLYAEPRRGSTFFIPTLRRALARRMWGQGLGSVPERRRCSTTAAKFSLKAIVRALEHLRLFAYPRKKYSEYPCKFLAYPSDKSYSKPV